MDLIPAVVDSSGYRLTQADLAFLSISTSEFEATTSRQAPLGMTVDRYTEFVATLFEALSKDGVLDADVRIQGSSVRFYSGAHKEMPYSTEDLASTFLLSHDRLPTADEVAAITAKRDGHWNPGGPRPYQRPFDSLFVLGIDHQGSDYDVQISSNDVELKLEFEAREIGADLRKMRVTHESYNFFLKSLIGTNFLALTLWRGLAEELVERPVSIAVFGRTGPPISVDGGLSSHFKDDDWIVEGP